MYISSYVWSKKKKLISLPACEEVWPYQVLTTATIRPQFKKKYIRNTFDNRIITIYSIYDPQLDDLTQEFNP
jgi:hypothetical protein